MVTDANGNQWFDLWAIHYNLMNIGFYTAEFTDQLEMAKALVQYVSEYPEEVFIVSHRPHMVCVKPDGTRIQMGGPFAKYSPLLLPRSNGVR